MRLLPDSVANQIAAGEVIQRPASVIKELVENSIDAGATSVTIILKDAGRTLIQVIDNGCGMSDTDARLAFERHATSKIRKADDLFSLSTMGFRGEALASIAAIAQVDLRTMLKGETIGTRLLINGSKVESQEPEACAQGSNLMVKNLFFNVPARRKFLKKDSVELSNIMREFERLALVNIGVDFTLISNDVTLHSLRRASLKQRIADLFGRSLDKQIVPLDTDTSIVRINGFIGLPENARKRNALQYLMVNGRNMRHPYFHKAIMQCYERLITADVQPNYFINLTVDPETIDVNIHPTKSEIKFENEQAIWQILTAAVRESLGRFNAAPAIDFDVDEAPDIPVFSPDIDADHEVILEQGYNPFAQPAHATRSSSLSGGGSSVSGMG
ncbi:MAG: DNA mismatch repair endonuclease MutL, partial [Duncaniella sp.]|nr:DNA mismatch repair endonuclease MutL [Duncaniella sp.]